MGERYLYPPDDRDINFSRGVDSLNPPHMIPLHAHQTLQNVILDEQGAVTKRWGYANGQGIGTSAWFGMCAEFTRNNGTAHQMVLYGAEEEMALRNKSTATTLKTYTAVPFKLTVTDLGTGAVGANLASGTLYQYAVAALKADAISAATKRSPYNLLVDAATVGEITTGGTAYPIKVDAYGVYGAATYEVWRRTYSGTWSQWGRLTTAVTHTSASGATTLTYTDSGSVVPDTAVYNVDLTVYRTTSAVFYFGDSSDPIADWTVVRKSGDNVLLFTQGAGLFWTDGSNGYAVQPSTTTLGGVPLTENRLWDVTDEVWTGKGLHVHHRYVWVGDMTNFPQTFVYSDLDDFGYFPQNGYINVPDPLGGRILDFATKDKVLVTGMTTGLFALWGTEFLTSGPDPTLNYFTKISDVGVASEWSMQIGPNGGLVYHGSDKQPHILMAITPELQNSAETRLCESIYPTVKAFADHDDAFACVDGNTYYLLFPSDEKVLKVRFFDTPGGSFYAPTIDTNIGADALYRFSDGKLYAMDTVVAGAGLGIFEMYKVDTYTDKASTAVTMTVKTAAYDCGLTNYLKRFVKNHTTYKVGSTAYTMTMTPYVDNQTLTVATLSSPADSSYQTPKTSELECRGRGRYAVFQYTNASTTVRPTLYGFRIEYVPKRIPSGDA